MDDQGIERPLFNAERTADLLSVSKVWLYRLPPDTPGVFCLGRSKRFDPDALKAWARGEANNGASNGH